MKKDMLEIKKQMHKKYIERKLIELKMINNEIDKKC
jgi:hypothetical protein